MPNFCVSASSVGPAPLGEHSVPPTWAGEGCTPVQTLPHPHSSWAHRLFILKCSLLLHDISECSYKAPHSFNYWNLQLVFMSVGQGPVIFQAERSYLSTLVNFLKFSQFVGTLIGIVLNVFINWHLYTIKSSHLSASWKDFVLPLNSL